MKPIKLKIRRKTQVLTKHQIKYQFRSDWQFVKNIEYHETKKIFKKIGCGGLIETDSQFAKLLKITFGNGIYSIIAWRKGRRGFWGFFYVEITDNGFRKLRKMQTSDEKEIDNVKVEMRKLKEQLSKTKNIDERNTLLQEIDELMSNNDFNKEINNLEKPTVGPTPYLTQTHPIYKFHAYSNVNTTQNKIKEVSEQNEFW